MTHLAHAGLALLIAGVILAACLDRSTQESEATGHENANPPAAKPQQKQADRDIPESRASKCGTINDRAASIIKVTPSAAIYRHVVGSAAEDQARMFNATHGTHYRADEAAIVVAPADWGDRAILLLAVKGCASGTAQMNFKVPG